MRDVASLASLQKLGGTKDNLLTQPYNPATEFPWRNMYWAEGANGTPFVDGQTVAQWDDQVGAKHLIQATAGSRPTYRASVAALNGLPALEFDSDCLYLDAATFGTVAQVFSFGMIFAFDTPDATADTLFGSATATECSVGKNTTPVITLNAGTALNTVYAPDSNAHFMAGAFNGVSSYMTFDQQPFMLGAAGANSLAGLTLSGANSVASSHKVYIAYFAIYQGLLGLDGATGNNNTVARMQNWARRYGAAA